MTQHNNIIKCHIWGTYEMDRIELNKVSNQPPATNTKKKFEVNMIL